MKKLLFLALFALPFLGSAQLEIPVKFGLNFTQFDSDPDSLESNYRLGYNIGADLRFGETGIFMTGCHFYRMQTDLKTKSEIETEESISDELTFDALNVPVNFGLFFLNEDDIKIYVVAGMDVWIPFSITNSEDDLTWETRPFYLSGSGHLGFQFWKINLDVGYDQAFTQLVEANDNSKSKTWGASIGFVF